MASVLAVRDLRHRVQQALPRRGPGQPWEAGLLALDPLALLRCMRVAHSPIYELPRRLMTISELGEALGRALLRRALNTPVADAAGTGPLRRLWLHAVATAHAARGLARASGECDPDRAYVLGLLHDLPLWLHYLSLRRRGTGPAIGAATWIRQWHLPDELLEVVEQTMLGPGQRPPGDPQPTSVVAAAELLAELADFWHPDDGDVLSRKLLLSVVTPEDLAAAHELRQEVAQSLADFGLSPSSSEPEKTELLPTDGLELFRQRSTGNIAELVLSLLSCNASAHYRGVITATTAAALRYLGFERTYSVQYSSAAGRCWVRAKSDLSPRPLRPRTVTPNANERAALDRARETGEAQHLFNYVGADGDGLLRLLGSDDVLIAPVNRDFAIPTFIVMDRALSVGPIRLSQDRVGAQALAGMASILAENLLLTKQRARAQKYSLTDPLTRIYNRSVGISTLEQEMARARRSGAPLTVLMLDLDDFKALNDTRGHIAGDQALRTTADVLRKTLRKTDILCRYGGEEFLIVLPETSLEEASVSATRIFTAVEEVGGKLDLPLTISIGLAAVQPSDTDVESVLNRADRALYASKTRGRNRFSVDEE